jgi:hypothetical protein
MKLKYLTLVICKLILNDLELLFLILIFLIKQTRLLAFVTKFSNVIELTSYSEYLPKILEAVKSINSLIVFFGKNMNGSKGETTNLSYLYKIILK